MNVWELEYSLVVLENQIQELTRHRDEDGKFLGLRKMSSTDKNKAKALEKSIRILREFGTLDVETEDFIGKEKSKMRDVIKRFN